MTEQKTTRGSSIDGAASALDDELCSVCGRPPHVCDDPECVPVRDLAYVNCPICGETAGTNETAINKKLVRTRRVLAKLLYAFDNDTTTAAQLRKVYAAEIAEAEALLHNAEIRGGEAVPLD